MPSETMRRLPFAVYLALAWLLVAAWLLTEFWSATAETLSDPDDAMRLVEVRAFLAGQHWFDLSLLRLDPPAGYLTHWSRLIDAGLAGLFVLFHQFVDAPMAERLMRAVWPVLWLLPAMGGAAAIAWRLAGREAALVALLLAVFGLPAFQHFKPGRIDHHNVQIVLALLTVAATVWSDRVRWAGIAAGLLSALALAVGFESLPYIGLCGAALALHYVVDATAAAALARYGWSLALGVIAAFFVSVGPGHYVRGACDAIAINTLVPVVVGGLGLAAAAQILSQTSTAARLAAIAATAVAALVLFVIIDPLCLGGPYAVMDPAARPIWLAHVREMEPLLRLMQETPVMGLWVSAFPAVALAAAALLAFTADARRDFAFLFATAALVIAVAATFTMVKAYSYAMWLAMPLVAAAAINLFGRLHLRPVLRPLAALVLTPVALSASAISLAQAAVPERTAAGLDPIRQACFKTASYAPLARLPVGFVVADVDYGPFLLALTPHAVLAAPYHRLSAASSPRMTLSRCRRSAHGCCCSSGAPTMWCCAAGVRPSGLDQDAVDHGLWGALKSGRVPDWLEPVPAAPGQVFLAYRLKR